MIHYRHIVAPFERHLARTAHGPQVRVAIDRLLAGDSAAANAILGASDVNAADRDLTRSALAFRAYQAREPERALELLDDVVTSGAIGAYALALAGACHLGQSNHDSAIACFRQALRIDPALHAAHTLLWAALARDGRAAGAIRALKDVLGAVPHREAGAPTTHVEDTTLCVIDCANHGLAARALSECLALCSFEHVKWLTDRPVAVPGVRTVQIPRLASSEAYSHFVLKDLINHVDTDYVLIAQWDGYVVNPAAWTPEFLLFDYVGAPWDNAQGRKRNHHNVGNGGFSLRSMALLEALQDPGIAPGQPEDLVICRQHREYLEDRHGIVFAPEDIASRFSMENLQPADLPFGFHGVMNLARFTPVAGLATLDYFFGA